jgi:hypothetical protein
MEDEEDAKFCIDFGVFDDEDSINSNSKTNSYKQNSGVVSKWSDEEDDRLRKTIGLLGAKNWKKISSRITGRTSTQ